MSSGDKENPVLFRSVDVDLSLKENSENSSASGIDTVSSCTESVPALSVFHENVAEPSESPSQEEVSENITIHVISPITSPTSISPEIKGAADQLLSFDDFSLHKTDDSIIKSYHNHTNDDCDCNDILNHKMIKSLSTDNNDSQTNEYTDVGNNKVLFGLNMVQEQFDSSERQSDCSSGSPNKNSLATSSLSLHEQSNSTLNMCKSHSKSAENILSIETNQLLNDSPKEFNTEKILSQFEAQKNKASATQLMSDVSNTTNISDKTGLDARYSRLPKELLQQDLGSIVKNVHGIFSSVSGSLKHAYNQTHRVAPKPQIKSIPNGKVMNDIFEEEQNEKQICQQMNQDIKKDVPNVDELKTQSSVVYPDENEKRDMFRPQVETLERVLAEQRKDNAVLRERVKEQTDKLHEKELLLKEFEVKLDLMSKRTEQAEREKDAAVMRYASVECTAIEARRAADKAMAAERAALAELELQSSKLKSAHVEKQRICQMYDDKCHEVSNGEREIAKQREEIKELEGRLKWTQSKLRMEMDAYKESAERADRLSQQVAELEGAKETAAVGAADSARAKQQESELKEIRAALILCRHEKEELERRLASTTQQLDTCKRERDDASGALARTTAEVQQLKDSNMRLEEEAAELAALRAQAALADTLSAQLQRESERASLAEETLISERARVETCLRREAAALEHAARVTSQHVATTAQYSHYEAKSAALSSDNACLRDKVVELEERVNTASEELRREVERRGKETRALARRVAELTEEVAEANKQLEWEKGENGVLKKKHASAVKELNRELQRALKRCEQLEARITPPLADCTTGSISSLSSGECATQEEKAECTQNGHSESGVPDVQVREPDRQALIERIVCLQRAAARRAERCEFLEEHSKQLTEELRAKSKLLRNMLCALPAGAVTSPDSDKHKKEIARLGGGAMAAVWGGDPAGMTLELSLQMNTRLQAVLEDALLKNITLKENLDTLGEEITRLKGQRSSDTKPK